MITESSFMVHQNWQGSEIPWTTALKSFKDATRRYNSSRQSSTFISSKKSSKLVSNILDKKMRKLDKSQLVMNTSSYMKGQIIPQLSVLLVDSQKEKEKGQKALLPRKRKKLRKLKYNYHNAYLPTAKSRKAKKVNPLKSLKDR